jgi:Tfp pilus assembly protein PilF
MSAGSTEPSRNNPCPCGSGKKYKKCCLGKTTAAQPTQSGGGLFRQQLARAYDLEESGQLREAGRMYEQLLKTHPNHPALLWGQGRCFMHFKLREAAATVLEQAVSVYPAHEQMVEDVIGRLVKLGKPDTALRISDKALKDFPASTGILINRGDTLSAMGRDEDAIALYREVLQLLPEHAGVTLSLVRSLRNKGEIDEAIAEAQQGLAVTTEPGLVRAGLLNQLAHCQDSQGDYEHAFPIMVESGAMALATPQARSVDSEAYLRRLDSYQQWLDVNELPVPTPSACEADSRLVFVLGFPRSGTTLLESMLIAAPGVISSGEAALLDAAISKIMSSGVSIENTLDAMGPGSQELLAEARSEYWRRLQASYGNDYQVFIDKQPMNTLYLAHIKILFPNAKIIFCQRDPRDVCLSCFFQWFLINGTNKLFLDWQTTADLYSKFMNYWSKLEPVLGDTVYKVRYEELVGDFPQKIRELVKYAGIPWDDSILSFSEINREKYFTTPSNRAVREGVKKTAVQRWEKYPDAIRQVEDLLSPIVERFGYS